MSETRVVKRCRTLARAARGCVRLGVLAGLATLALLLAPAPAAANNDIETLSLHQSFDYFWNRYLEAATAGDLETSGRMLDEMRRLRVERNAFSLHDISLSFVYQGLAFLQDGQLDAAREQFRIARELSPDLATAHWALAKADESAGGLGLLTSGLHRGRAIVAGLTATGDGGFARWNLAFVLLFGFGCVLLAFAALMLYRYGVLFVHDVEERFGHVIGARGALGAVVGILLLPLVLTVGIGWLAPYWLALTYGYQSVKERAVTWTALALLLLGAPISSQYATWARTTTNPLYHAALSSTTGTFDVADVALLREAARQNPSDRDLKFLIATQFKNLGDYELAAMQYDRILQASPNDLDAKMNLGNIRFAQQDWEGALRYYDEVLASDPNRAMAHYNKSLAHAENFQFGEREQSRAQADRLDGAAVAAHEGRTGDFRVVYDQRLDANDILAKFHGLSSGVHAVPRRTLFVVPTGAALRFVFAPLALAALILLLELVFRDRRLTQRCWKCSSAFCGRCQIGTGRKGLCTQCYHLFIMKDGVSVEARNERLAQVQRATTIRGLVFRLLSIVAPGSGHISEGMPLLGVCLLLLWFLGAGLLAFGKGVYSVPNGLFDMTPVPAPAVMALMAVVLVVANILSRPLARG